MAAKRSAAIHPKPKKPPEATSGALDPMLARLAVARGFASRITAQIDEIIELYLMPDEDPKGEDREAMLESIIEEAGRLSRVVEKAQAIFEELDPLTPSPEETDDDEVEE